MTLSMQLVLLLAVARVASAVGTTAAIALDTTANTNTTVGRSTDLPSTVPATTEATHVCDIAPNACTPDASECVPGETSEEYFCRCVRPFVGADSQTGADCAKLSISTGGEAGSDGSIVAHVAKGGDLKLVAATGGRTVGLFALEESMEEARNALNGSIGTLRDDFVAEAQGLQDAIELAVREIGKTTAARTDAVDKRIGAAEEANGASKVATVANAGSITSQGRAIASLQAQLRGYTTLAKTTQLLATERSTTAKSLTALEAKINTAIANAAPSCPNQRTYSHVLKSCLSPMAYSSTNTKMADVRYNGCWQDVSRRSFSAQKWSSTSMLKVQMRETYGVEQSGRSTTACKFRLLVNGDASREVWSHSSSSRSWRINPLSYNFLYAANELNLHPGSKIDIRLQSCRQGGASSCLFGWPNGQIDNGFEVEEVSSAVTSSRRYMRDLRLSSRAGHTAIPDRQVKYKVKGDDTMLQVTYSDVLGQYQRGGAPGCEWIFTMNGRQIDKAFTWHASRNNGWYIEPKTMQTYVAANQIKKGTTYTFEMRWKIRSSGASNCLAGWAGNQVHNVMLVREIPADPQLSLTTFSRLGAFTDRRTRSTGWSNVATRVLQVEKYSEDTALLVELSDTIGYYQTRNSQACSWRVLFNGGTYGSLAHSSHSEAQTGWRIQGNTVVFKTRDVVPAGKWTVQLQAVKHSGASECLNGWPQGAGSIKVTEVR